MSAETLSHVLRPLQAIFNPQAYPDLLIGLGVPDDAAVWRLADGRLLVITTDFFTPVVDEAYDYGAIAAANALSDLYAMGAKPFLALNIAAMPANLPIEVVTEILRGGAEKVREAGAVIAGGHTVQDHEPKYGLVAIGFCTEESLMTKAGAKAGEVLVLTKPLGTGVTSTALKRGTASPAHVDAAVDWMARLNAPAAELAASFEVHAATDVTGFGFLGHAVEMAENSGVGLSFYLPNIPFLAGAREYAEGGNIPGGTADNKIFFGDKVSFDASVDEYDQILLFDAQTSGGLLLAVAEARLAAFLEQAADRGIPAWPIGTVEEGQGVRIRDQHFMPDLQARSPREGLRFTQPH